MLPSFEQIPREPETSFNVRAFSCPAFPFFWHVHPEHELTLIVSGRGQRFVGDSIEPFAEGEVVLLASGVPHSWRSDAEGPACSAAVAQFRDDAFGLGFFDLPELSVVRALLTEARHGLAFRDASASSAVARLARRRPATRVPALLDALLLLTQTPGRRLCDAPAHHGVREGDLRRVDAACRMLNTRYVETVALHDVAAVVGLTPASACRLFRRVMGRTVVSYLHELRVAHACRLLADTDDPVTAVCFASGFGNVANFNRVFRRLRGVSPREFRRSVR